MESLLTLICSHANEAHWIIFAMLLLAGLNVPFSEDILILTGGILASTCVPDHTVRMYLWIFFGCWISAWEAYWLGRLLGPKLYNIRWFSYVITPHRIERLHYYYEKFGILTFIVGRFCPGGIRNGLFMTSGLGKMPFPIFVARDVIACLISTLVLFYIGYQFGEHHEIVFKYFKRYEIAAIILIVLLAISVTIFFKRLAPKK